MCVLFFNTLALELHRKYRKYLKKNIKIQTYAWIKLKRIGFEIENENSRSIF